MRKTLLRMLIVAGAVGAVGAGSAYALQLQVGKIVLDIGGGFSPTTLPKRENAPIKLRGYIKIATTDGSHPSPLTRMVLEFDKHGAVETRGLPKCTMRKLIATTTRRARKMCPGAVVGKGFGTAIVKFPEQAPIKASSPLTIFNGPEKHGNPTVLGHAYLTVAGSTTYVVPIEIQKVRNGRYGFKVVVNFPRISGGYGSPVYGRLKIGRTWKHKGKTLSYANARCADGRLQARGQFTFKDGTFVQGTLFRPCKVARGRK